MIWPWVLTATGIWGMHLAGKKNALGWLVGLLAEILWIVYAVQTAQWGFLAGAAFYIWVFGKNYIEWRRDDVYSRGSDSRTGTAGVRKG